VESLLRTVTIGAVKVDRAQIAWWIPFIGSLCVGGVIAASILAGRPEAGIPAGAGALFVVVAASAGPLNQRLRIDLWALMWFMLASGLGAIFAADGMASALVGVAVAPVVAFVAGYVGCAGPVARMVGMLSLVLFAVFMGIPDTPVKAWETFLLVGLGGLVPFAVLNGVRLVGRLEPTWGAPRVEPGVWHRMRVSWSASNDFLRHGVRLGLAFGVATALSLALGWPDQYWIPMTVAWVAMPDSTGTATRVVARVLGTLLGLALIVPLIHVWQPGPWGTTALCTISSLLAFSFLRANYGLAVVGVTIFVVSIMSFLGDSVGPAAQYRAIDTVIAGVIAVLAALVWPSESHEHRQLFRSTPQEVAPPA